MNVTPRWIARARNVAKTAHGVWPLTWLGLGCLLSSAASLYYIAYRTTDLVVYVAGSVVLGLVALALLLTTLGAIVWAIGLRKIGALSVTRVETGRQMSTGVRLPSLGWIPFIQTSWSWQDDAIRCTQQSRWLNADEQITATARGHHDVVVRVFTIGDVFRLCRITFSRRGSCALDALPHLGALTHPSPFVAFAAGDETPHPLGLDEGDRVDLRKYTPGDSARLIHWRVYARTKKLVTRVHERALTRLHRTGAYLVTGVNDEASAAVARLAVESGALGEGWVFAADGSNEFATQSTHAVDMIVRSKGAAASGTALAGFVTRIEKEGPAGLVLFVPPVPGKWIEGVRGIAQGRAHRVRVVIGTDTTARTKRLNWIQKLLLRKGNEERTATEDLEQVVTELAKLNLAVTLLDRVSGRVLGAEQRHRLRELEAA